MSAITAKASRKMKKYAVLTREPRCFLGSFDFSWEQRKFEEIAVRSSVICSDDTLPRVEYEDIVSGTGRLNKDIYAKQSIKSGIAFHQGDVLYGKLRPYLQNWLLPTFDGLAVGDFWVLQPQNADSSFLYRLIQSRQFDEVANQSTGTKMPRADWKLVSKTVFSIPSNISEQAAIGTYFTALDSLITLHQRKCVFLFGFFQAFISMIFTASTFSWEQRKLGDVGETYTGLSGKTKADFGHGQARFVTYMNVFSNPISNPEMTEPIEIDPKQNEVEVGDVFFTTSSETPEEVGMSSILLEKRGKTYLNSFCFGFRPSEKIDSYYLAYMLRSESTRAKIILLAQGISRYNISKNKVMEIAVSLPSLDEQKLIGQYFSQLDNLITLHQRKFEKLTNVKKSMLEKMFPQNGSSYPEIRFKGFTDPWEQRKLGEIGSVSMCRRIFKEQTSETGDIPFYKIGTFGADPDAFISRELFEEYKSKYPYPQKGDILISASGSIGRTVEFAGNNEYFQDSNIVWLNHDERLSNPFLKCFYSVVKWAGIEGSTIKRLYNDNILNTVICMPSVPEQKRIGLFFENLDNLITLHQRELEKLQNIKKSMLEKMFV